jgi:hypothetical protein
MRSEEIECLRGAASFRVEGDGAECRLLLRNSVTRWRVPE